MVVDRQALGTFDLFERALIGDIWTFITATTPQADTASAPVP